MKEIEKRKQDIKRAMELKDYDSIETIIESLIEQKEREAFYAARDKDYDYQGGPVPIKEWDVYPTFQDYKESEDYEKD